ncbi:hypothetical protein Vafri_14302, partial [Volvox africanus]
MDHKAGTKGKAKDATGCKGGDPVDIKRPRKAEGQDNAEPAPKRGQKAAKEAAAPTPPLHPEPSKPVAAPAAPVNAGGGKPASLKRKGRSTAIRAANAPAATDEDRDAADAGAAAEKNKMDEHLSPKQQQQQALAGKSGKRGRPAKRAAIAVEANAPTRGFPFAKLNIVRQPYQLISSKSFLKHYMWHFHYYIIRTDIQIKDPIRGRRKRSTKYSPVTTDDDTW